MKIFAHRGVSALFPENSQTAILACDSSCMYGIEVDLFQAQDEFFIVHDPWLSRLFGINKKVTASTSEELAGLVCLDNKPIPTLAWLIKNLAGKGLSLNIEIKTVLDIDSFIEHLAELLKKHQFPEDLILISSFNHEYLAHVHSQKPTWKLGMLIAHLPLSIDSYVNKLPLFSMHLSIDAINARVIAEIKKKNLQVYVYTVDQAEDILWLAENKVDGIFANHPEQAFKIANNLM